MPIDYTKPLPPTFNPSTPEGQEHLQKEGVELISRVPYGGVDPKPDQDPEESARLDEFLDGISELFSDEKIPNPYHPGASRPDGSVDLYQ